MFFMQPYKKDTFTHMSNDLLGYGSTSNGLLSFDEAFLR